MFLSLKTLYRKRTVIWPFYFYTIIRTLSLPTSAIVQKRYVLILKNGKITKREVTYKKSLKSGYINITKGLLIDEKVVKNPTSKLINIYI
ncbi:hypothetical protein FH487_10265 [Staphylococcus epidermidis]|nr:hypothetical protein FH487_10265 [Staphylococcus epidermidis]QRJ14838.1 hypothetical protein HJI05_10215 [Staphylococcus epidermidis]